MAALFRWAAACHREGRKRREKRKESHHLVTKVLLFTTTFRRASRTHTHTLLLATSYFRDTVDILGRLIFWDKARDTRFFFGLLFSSLGEAAAAGQAEVGNLAAAVAAAEREGIPSWMDGRMDGWTEGRMGSMAGRVWCISLSFVEFFCVRFLEQEREREREREGYPVAANSCQFQRRRLHAYNPPLPHIPNTHTHTLFTRV